MKKKTSIISFLFVLLMSFTLFNGLFQPKSIAADGAVVESNGNHFQVDAKWIDRHKILITKFELTDDEFVNKEGGDRNYINGQINKYLVSGAQGEKPIQIDNISPDENNGDFYIETGCGAGKKTKFQIEDGDKDAFGHIIKNNVFVDNENLWLPKQDGNGCWTPLANANAFQTRKLFFSPSDESNRAIYFRQKDGAGGTIFRVDNNDGDFVKSEENGRVFKAGAVNNCNKRVEFKQDPVAGIRDAWYESCAGGRSNGDVTVVINDPNQIKQPGKTTGDGTSDIPLECSWSINPLTWLMCPIIKGASETVTALDGAINDQLTIKTNEYFDETSGTGKNMYSAWSGFRWIAWGLLVIIALVMILAQALSLDFVDAYTLKKVVPRIIVSIVLIALSWPLMRFAIDLSNVVGLGVRSLIYAPFTASIAQGGNIPTISGSGSTVALGGLAVAAGAFGILGMLSFALTALLAVIIAFAVLVVRQMIIILLVIVAPVAIILNILPNTQKAAKIWWDFFMRALLVFPIISMFIATGRVFAMVVANSSQKDSLLGQFLIMVGYFGPYFALPTAFRLAGGAIANISGMVNDRGRGAFDRLKGFRQKRAQGIHERRMEGTSWGGNGRTGRAYRRVATGSLSPTARGRARFQQDEQKRLMAVTSKMLEEDKGRSIGDDDATALAVQQGMTGRRFIQEYMERTGRNRAAAESALTAMETNLGAKMGTDAMRVAAFRARSASTTAYSGDAEGTRQRINEGAALAAAGLISTGDAVSAAKANRGRADISDNGFGAHMNHFQSAIDSINTGGEGMSVQQAEGFLDETLNSGDPGNILAGNTRTITALAPSMTRRLGNAVRARNQALAAGDTAAAERHDIEVNRALGQIAGVQDNLNRTSPEKAALFADLVNGTGIIGINGDDQPAITVRAAVEQAAARQAGDHGQQAFLEVRKEWSNAARQAGADQPPAPEPEPGP